MKHILNIALVSHSSGLGAPESLRLSVSSPSTGDLQVPIHLSPDAMGILGDAHLLPGVFNSHHLMNVVTGTLLAAYTPDTETPEEVFVDPDTGEQRVLKAEIEVTVH